VGTSVGATPGASVGGSVATSVSVTAEGLQADNKTREAAKVINNLRDM
jgi:hypothetical protein